ncbi:MAG: alpha-D-ribose 1-methylphosphonate 5-triphosphate diphosphatase [Desulfocurvibacter africanus]
MNRDLVIRNARMVTATEVVHGSLLVQDGRIAALDGESCVPRSNGCLDLEGDFLVPGLIELHTDYLETQLQPRPGVIWPSPLAAVLAHDTQLVGAGITTVLDSICCGDLHKGRSRSAMLGMSIKAVRDAVSKGVLRAEHYLHLRCEVCDPDTADMFEPLAGEDNLKLVSLMDHTPGQRQFSSLEKFRQYYRSKSHSWSDAEFEDLRRSLVEQQERNSARNRTRILELCRQLDLPVASHDDTLACHIIEAVADGVAISEFPTTLEAAQAARAAGIAVVMGAPNVVRGGSHSGNVSALDLAKEGLLDCLSSDYVPASLLHAAFALHEQAGMDLPQAMATVTVKPAELLGLEDRGSIAPDKRADLLRVHLVDGHPVVRSVWREGRQIF